MEIEETSIKGLKIVHINNVIDERGTFLKVFNDESYKKNGLETNFKESYFSVSYKNVIRGMHFQAPPYEHSKIVILNYGKILDVVLDLRRDSLTFKNYLVFKLETKVPKLIYIPIGCAHGFLSLEDMSVVTYFQTSVYNKSCDMGIKYDSFGMDWGLSNPIVSLRDRSFVGLAEFNTPF